MQRSGLCGLILVSLALSHSALAQVKWDMPGVIVDKPKFDRSGVASRMEVWPRLDPGAVFCKTEADLQRLVAFRRGEQVDRPNCQLIHAPTAISIVRRAGPGRTEVALTDQNGLDGWTDVWLPERAPTNTGTGVPLR